MQKKHDEESTMNHQIVESQGKRYLHLKSSGSLIHSEQDALDIVSLCIEHDADAALLEGDSLSDDFVKLSTGLAGAALQKFGNYIKVAAAIKGGQNFPARFQEAVSELGARNTFRIFTNPEDAASWLCAREGEPK